MTAATKLATGWWAARRAGIDSARPLAGRRRPDGARRVLDRHRGPGRSAGLEPRLGPLSAAYVLLLAVLGPILVRLL